MGFLVLSVYFMYGGARDLFGRATGSFNFQFAQERISGLETITCDGVWDLLLLCICQTDSEYLLSPIN